MITSKSKKTKIGLFFRKGRWRQKKVNFMVNHETLEALKEWIPAGDRSNFVNGALEDAVRRYKERKRFN